MKKKKRKSAIIKTAAVATGCAAAYYYAKKHINFKEEKIVIENSRHTNIHATIVVPQMLGSFPLVMFFHGFGNDRELNGIYTEVAHRLGKIGVASVRLDFAGCGESEESYLANCMHNDLSDIDACYKYMSEKYNVDISHLALCGHSMGARLAIIYAGYRKEFKNMILLAPNAMPSFEMMENFFGTQEQIKEYRKVAKENGYVVLHDRTLSLDFFKDMEKYNPIEDIREFKGNILYYQGSDDTIVKPDISGIVCQNLNEKVKLNYVYLDGVDHMFGMSNKDEAYQEVINGIYKFVQRNV